MVDVFVSYSSQDRDAARPIVAALESVGWSVWWDRQIDAGSAFDREIEKAIDTASCVVVIWSGNSVESEWVRTEANEGLERNVLVPVAIEPVRPPLAFRRIQTIDLTSPEHFDALTEAVARLVAMPTGRESEQTPFTGHEKELAILDSRVHQIERGQGDFVLLAGEAGVGKTRLVQEAAEAASRRGALVLTGHCQDMDGAPPYQPLIEQIEQASRLVDTNVMRQTLGENAPEMSRLMPELRQRFDDIPEPVELPQEQERRYVLHGVGEFIHRAAVGRQMVLVFEDLHWADDSTCVLLRYLADRLKTSRVLMLGTYRDTELDSNRPFSRMLQELSRERLVHELPLQRLGRDEVASLLQRKAGQEPPAELVELVFSETEGNPFFVEEVYRHLQDTGKMFNDSGGFAAGIEIADTEVPRGVRLILSERLERVGDDCRSALSLGAVIGRQFSFEVLLAATTRLDEDSLLDALDEGIEANLIEDASQDREARYGFVHEQVRQTLLSALSLPRRQRMHLRVADAIEARAGDRSGTWAGEISHHLYQAGAAADEDRTIRYLLLAAERATQAIAFEDALRHYDTALSILPTDRVAEAAHIHSGRAATMRGLERFDEALEILGQAINALPAGDERDGLVLQRCRILLDIWRGSETIDDLEALLSRRQEGENRDAELEARQWLARAYYVMSLDREGYAQKAIEAYEDTIALARELGNRRELGRALVATAQLTDYVPGFTAQARRNLDEAEVLAAELGSEDLDIEVATARLNVYLSKSRDEYGETVLKKLENRRDPIRLNAHYFRMMWSTYGAGRLQRCVEICDAGTELAYRIGTLPVQYPTIKGMALMDLGRFGEAWQAIDDEIADDAHRFGAALQALGRLQYELNVGAFDDAIARAPMVVSESKALSRLWMLNWICNGCAHATCLPVNEHRASDFAAIIELTGMQPASSGRAALAMSTGDHEQAVEILRARLKSLSQMAELRTRLQAQSLLVRALGALEDWQEVIEVSGEALATARECEMAPLEWLLLVQQGQAQRGLGDAAAADQLRSAAEACWHEVSQTIPDLAHREHYTRLAEAAGI